MAGTCDGFSNWEWKLLGELCPLEAPKLEAPKRRGRPDTPLCKMGTPVRDVLITGCRWCALPCGPHWASKRAAPHKRFKSITPDTGSAANTLRQLLRTGEPPANSLHAAG
jgi:hypothetical protein